MTGSSTFYGYDQQGSARILAGASGSVTDNYSFKAFGEELQSGSGTVNPYRYVGAFGYYRDAADWRYVRARWLAAESGRWVSVDALWPAGAKYAYADGRPAKQGDPTGMLCGPLCENCGTAILFSDYCSAAHYCNHPFEHCRACCVATRAYGAKCALCLQVQQDGTPNRMKFCRDGIDCARKKQFTCTACCIRKHPWPKPKACCATDPCCDLRPRNWALCPLHPPINCCTFLGGRPSAGQDPKC